MYELKLELSKKKCNTIIIENSKLYRNVVDAFIISATEDNDEWIFSKDEKEIKKSKIIELITSPFSIDFSNRKIQKCILDDFYNISMGEKYFSKTQECLNYVEKYVDELEYYLPYSANIDMTDFHNIIKASVTGITVPEGIVEKIVEYIKVCARILSCDILVMIGCQCYFSQEEWKSIVQTAVYEDLYLLCFEAKEWMQNENVIIIDNDCCRIV